MDRTQNTLIVERFGARADAYLGSVVHAQGADLAALAALVASRPGCRVLDLGCGGGHVAYAAAEAGAGEVVACDLSAEMLAVVAAEAARRGLGTIRTEQASAERLPFAGDTFDVVLSRYSAHHWRDFDAGVGEAARVLRRGGVAGFADAVSAVPGAHDSFLQATELLRDTSHVRDRSVAEWIDAATRAGLTAVQTTTDRARMEFPSWITRMATPADMTTAIRALQAAMSTTVREHFAVEADGSFTIDTATMVFAKP